MTALQGEPALRSNRREALVASAFAGYCGWRRSRSVSSTAKSAAAFTSTNPPSSTGTWSAAASEAPDQTDKM